jgi:SAM-dependent methyltransferase
MGVQEKPASAFEKLTARYDAWYDTAHGQLLFDLELACLRPLLPPGPGPRLEVGVGSGRFAAALGLGVGVDPALAPLRLAAGRAVAVVQGAGERLPFGDRTFGAVVVVATLCFADDPAALLGEARRVLVPSGRLVAGVVPLDSTWGRHYEAQGLAGHPFYRGARFLTLAEHRRMLADAGFTISGACSTLTQAPSDDPVGEQVHEVVVPGAGFVALQARPWPSPEGPAPRRRRASQLHVASATDSPAPGLSRRADDEEAS